MGRMGLPLHARCGELLALPGLDAAATRSEAEQSDEPENDRDPPCDDAPARPRRPDPSSSFRRHGGGGLDTRASAGSASSAGDCASLVSICVRSPRASPLRNPRVTATTRPCSSIR